MQMINQFNKLFTLKDQFCFELDLLMAYLYAPAKRKRQPRTLTHYEVPTLQLLGWRHNLPFDLLMF